MFSVSYVVSGVCSLVTACLADCWHLQGLQAATGKEMTRKLLHLMLTRNDLLNILSDILVSLKNVSAHICNLKYHVSETDDIYWYVYFLKLIYWAFIAKQLCNTDWSFHTTVNKILHDDNDDKCKGGCVFWFSIKILSCQFEIRQFQWDFLYW